MSLPVQYPQSYSLNIGVLLGPAIQLLDMAPVDFFHMLSRHYLDAIPMFPDFVRAHALSNITIWYIGENKEDKSEHSFADGRGNALTADATIKLTAALDSDEVQPGNLDILYLPGPDPRYVPSKGEQAFIQSHFNSGSCDVIAVCSGVFMAGHSGILDGRTATGPRGILPELKKKFNAPKWVTRRWVMDVIPASSKTSKVAPTKGSRPSELWTSGGIVNGHDLTAAYIRKHFDKELADLVLALSDVENRGQDYETGAVKDTGFWLWLIFRSWWNKPK